MSFEHHLFISYAHVDNVPVADGEKGWVTRFHDCLYSFLGHRLGGRARIWRDQKLRGNDEFGPEIAENLPNSAVLLSIVSPRYLESEWCIREVNTFCEHASERLGLKVGNKVRVFRVLTTPIDRRQFEVFPALSDKSLGYEFYEIDERDRDRWLDPDMGSKEAYLREIYHLADDIAALVHKLEESKGDPIASKGSDDDGLTVYLAECSYDRRDDRDEVAASLRAHGYRVLPENRLPRDEQEYRKAVAELLAASDLSIHLVGSSFGAVPDGPSQQSAVAIQNELAAERARVGDLRRLIWLPPGLQPFDEAQKAFIASLTQSTEAQAGADLIRDSLETLKGAMHTTLEKLESFRHEKSPKVENEEKVVYLVCAERDRGVTIELRKFLKRAGYEVLIPVFEGDASEVRRANESNYQVADAVILFYGDAGEAWKATTQNELRRMGSLSEGPDPSDLFIFLAGEETVDKREMIELEEDGLINGLNGFSDAIMSEFLDRVPA